MVKDPLYRKILERLSEPLDPEAFELCMADLLRDAFPGLVPVPGGNDAGMDGSIADASGAGEPFPLVCTTQKNVESNLAGSLDAFLERGLSSRKVVLATSQSLTPARRRKLHALARGKGFALLQIVERRGAAFRLYRNSRWRKDLLDLPGNPGALSVVPLTRRPLVDLKPIGREADLLWLRDSQGDRILSGEPGSGKTFLLHHLMLRGWEALFLTETDEGRIADAIRDLRPRVVVVDDAHANPDLLVKLRRLREDIGAQFDILAVTWEGGKDQVIEALGGIPSNRIRKLELLTRSEILEVIRLVGVETSDQVLADLRDQSANKPGLAVTIATLWLQGAWREILEGTVLRRTLVDLFRGLVGRDTTPVLAAFSLGGEAGMELDSVAEELQIGRADMWSMANGLSAGGVLSNLEGSRLAVRPAVLRSALLREVFFSVSGTSMPFRGLLARAPDPDRAIEAIATARLYGAGVSDTDLRQLVATGNSRQAWELLAASSEENAVWALEHYPREMVYIAGTALRRAPAITIRALLREAAEAEGDPESRPRHPLRVLGDWVLELDQNHPQETIQRRRLVARLAKEYLLAGGLPSCGIQALCIALRPSVENTRLDPLDGRSVTITWGSLSPSQLQEIASLWEQVRDVITRLDAGSWRHLKSMLWHWIHPEYSYKATEVGEEVREFMHAFAGKALRDLAPLAQASPGLTEELRGLARKLGHSLEIEPDLIYVALFPQNFLESGDLKSWALRQQTAMRKLAQDLINKCPQEVIEKIQKYEREARAAGRTWPRNTPALCRELALLTDEPEAWASAMHAAKAPADLLLPFLEEAANARRPEWKDQVRACLESDIYNWAAMNVVLRLESPHADLLLAALEESSALSPVVEDLSLRKEIPLPTLQSILRYPDRELSLAAAIGEWLSDPEGEVRQELLSDWKKAILDSGLGDELENTSIRHWLGIILNRTPELSFQWCQVQLRSLSGQTYASSNSLLQEALLALDEEKRQKLLHEIGSGFLPSGVVQAIVRKDLKIYQELLKIPSLARYHLEPLGGRPDDAWLELVIAALAAGYEPKEIAIATVSPPHSWWGSGKEYWREWDDSFSHFEKHDGASVQEVVRIGRQMVQKWIEDAEREERQEALYGLG